MRRLVFSLVILWVAGTASATVEIVVKNVNGMAEIHYKTTAAEPISAFALDVTVDAGDITGVSGFVRGESTATAPGYGIFPASFAAAITVDPETGEISDWNLADYTPLANPLHPGALGGLDTPGVTLEMGALFSTAEDAPALEGLLCKLAISEAANVTVGLNEIRGGIVMKDASKAIEPVLGSASVSP
ncbi:MAG: hypothetical protein HQ515_03330 [Phycisphaeraceae bacterium]|nr:hypothetical protein [Phycisphaeraceae bacterium]